VRGVPLNPSGEFAGSFLGLPNPFLLLVGLLTVAMFLVCECAAPVGRVRAYRGRMAGG